MSVQPGWYRDPTKPDGLRWWDGHGWTEHTTAAPNPAAERPATERPATERPYDPYLLPRQAPAADQRRRDPAGGSDPWWQPAPGPRSQGRRAASTPDGVALAPLAARLLARVVDWILVGMIGSLLAWPFIADAIAAWRQTFDRYLAALRADPAARPDVAALYQDQRFVHGVSVWTYVVLVLSLVWTVGFLAWRGATPGKMLCGVRVRSWESEGRPTAGQAALRWLTCEAIAAVPVVGPAYQVLDYLWPVRDRRRQALHDKLPRTCVVRSR